MGDIHNSRVNLRPELDNDGFCFDMTNHYHQLAKCRRIQENSTYLVLLKEYICNTGKLSRIKRIVRLYSSRNCTDPLVDALNFLWRVKKLHLQVCICIIYPLSQLIRSKQSRRATIEAFLATLAEANLVDTFDTALWCGLVDFVTVHSTDDVRITFRNRSIIPRYRKAVIPGTHTAEKHDFISSDQGSRSSISKSLLCSARSGNMPSRWSR